MHFDGERRGRRAGDMPAVTLVQSLKRLRAGTSSAPQSPPPAFLMSLTDVARGRRSVRDRTTTWATNGTGSKGLTARTPIHSRYAAAMRIAGWPGERRRVRDRGDRIRSESLDGARWRSARNDRDIGRIAPWEKALRSIGSRRSPLKCTGIRVASPRTYPHRRPPVGRFAARTHLSNSQRSESLYGGRVHIEKRASIARDSP